MFDTLRSTPRALGGVVAAATVSGAMLVAASPALAYSCGDNLTHDSAGHQQLVYRNCSNSTVHRKADVAGAGDGPCKTIYGANTGVGDVIILATVYDPGPNNEVYLRGSKSC